MKPFLRIVVALSFCISQSAFAQAIATGAGPETSVGMSGATTDMTTGVTTTVGSGVVPGGLEEAAASIKANVAIIAALPAEALAGMADFTIATLPAMQAGAAEYESTRVACYGAQTSASTMCMEQTNPNLISTIAKVNLGVAGLNSLAVNDACKSMSKIMTLAQAGMTGYLAVCGAMRLKCTTACGTTSAALTKLSGATTGSAFCKPFPGPQAAVGAATCTKVLASYTGAITKIKAALAQEANAADVTQRPIAAKVAVCGKGYGLMLASGAVSLISIVKSMKESRKCDDDTDAGGSSTSTAATDSSSTSATASTTTAGTATTGSGLVNETPDTSANLIVAPEASSSTGTADTTGASSQVRTANATGSGSVSGSRSSLSSSGSSALSTKSTSAELATTAPVSEATKVYQEYMPGGTKDPARNIAGQSAYEKEVTSAGGKSNWSKTRDAYRSLKTLEDE